MAHVTMHFALGVALATLIQFGKIRRILGSPDKIGNRSDIAALWMLWSYAWGVFASVPNLLKAAGSPEWFYRGWWMNVFLLHPLIDQYKDGGILWGATGIVGCFAIHYGVILIALSRSMKDSSSRPVSR